MGIVYFSNEFPREDLQTLFRHLHNHSKVKKHASLERFVHEATSAVKDEIRDLPADLQRLIPTFETVTSWAGDSTLREGRLCGAIDGVLLTVLQLAIYIGYIENYPNDFSSAKKKTLSALGVGLLSSAALSASSSIDDLVLLGVDVVRTAFRMGIHVFNVSSNLLPVDHENTPESWAYVVHNADSDVAQRDIDAFNTSEQISNTGKVFISAISRTAITISGPPSSLKSILNKCEYLRELKYISLPVFGGLCHAPHMYNQADVARILDSDKLNAKSGAYPVVRALRSTSSGIPFNAKNASDMLHAVVFELLTKTISWDSVVQNLVAEVTSDGLSCSTVQCFCNSMPLNDLRNVLEETTTVTTENLVSWVLQAQSPDSKVNGTRQSKLAIVGMACRLPGGANNTEKFWEILAQGLDVSRIIPPDRFDIETHYDPTGNDTNKTMTQYGCFIDEPGLFDAPFFNMSPREAQVVDPQMRLSLVTAYEALERAGYVANRTHSTKTERIGTFYGQAADDYREVNQGQEVSTYYIPGGCRAFGPGRINYFFKFAGPSYSIDTACSSGLAAIEIACQSLWNGEVDMAVTGGVNVLTNPDGFTGLNKGHFLTKGHNACKTWDAGADGYCRADGVGSLILKRLEDAQADNDRILGVILGAGTNHSAEAVSITHPHAGHQAYLARQVLRQAGVDPLDISYVELHGTGTQAGDSEEMQGIKDVYAPLVKRRRSDQPLHIGAVKANVGHGESVAGTTALLKVLLMLEKEAIPPHVGIKTQLNPGLGKDLEKRGMHIPAKMTPWLRDASKKRVVAINNFGAAGGNTTVILEEAPALPERQLDPRESHVVAVSAKTRASLSGNIERLLAYLEANPGIELSDLAYTTTARRYHHSFRVATAATNGAQLQKLLRSQLDHVEMIKPVGKLDQPQVAFTFTGQGAAHKSMNLELFHYSPVFQQEILNLDTIAQRQGFPSIVPALDGSFPKDHAHSPVVTQLALLCSQIALTKYWATLGVRPDIVLGHSLGEYAALHVAGVLSANDAIFLVGKRAEQLQQQCTIGSHAMLAVRASLSQIADSAAGKKYTIACINGPFDTVLSGTVSEMDDVTQPLEKAGFRCIKLDVAFAFHSKQTEPILDAFENLATTGVIFHEPKLPFVSPLCGKVVFDGKTLNARYVRRATRETVDFRSALEQAEATGAVNEETLWIEIGPHPVCTAFVKSSLPSAALAVPSMRRGEDNWKTMSDSMAALYLSGIAVDWHEFHRPFEQTLRLLDLPTYAFNDKKHWIQYEGTWCLTKGNTYYSNKDSNPVAGPAPASPAVNDFHTSTVQTITAERIDGNSGSVTMCSDLMQPDLLAAAHGHRMNECGVVTSSIHADIAYTLGKYLFYKFYPKSEKLAMNMTDLVVTKGLVAQKKSKTPQLFSVTAQTVDIESGIVDLTWANIAGPGVTPSEPFATAKLVFEDSQKWLSSWIPVVHLIRGRIEALEALAIAGKADRFSRNMAYRIFADRLVDYADKYRGMQSVVMHELEGFADVQLTTKESGVWTLPPYFIDSVAHLAGFIMNCSDAMDTEEKFCVTPGWDSMRFAKPLLPGARYRSYVKMIPTADDPTVYLGDVYIIQDDAIIGMVGAIKFRQYPRVLMNRFFSPPDLGSSNTEDVKPSQKSATHISAPSQRAIQPQGINRPLPLPVNLPRATPGLPKKVLATQLAAEIAMTADSAPPAVLGVAMKALEIIASEGGLDVADLADDAAFADLGIDSLMSLVLAEKFKSQLNVNVNGSLFLDYPTIGDLRKWLEECY